MLFTEMRPHDEVKLSFDWTFALGDLTLKEAMAGDGFRPVTVPHDWSLDYPFDETAELRKSLGFLKKSNDFLFGIS